MKPIWPGIDRHLAEEEEDDVEPPRPSSSPDSPRPRLRPSPRRRPAEECRRRTQTVRASLPCDSSPVPSGSFLTHLHVPPTPPRITNRKVVPRQSFRTTARTTTTMRTIMDPTGGGLTRLPRRQPPAAGPARGLSHCRLHPSRGYYWQGGRTVFQGTNLQQVQVHQETAQDTIVRPR